MKLWKKKRKVKCVCPPAEGTHIWLSLHLFMKRVIPYILAVFILARLVPLTGCANIIPPGGGPRDSLPPVLMNITPRDSATNFAGGKIVLTFNEFVEVNNLQENLVVSPLPKILPIVDAHLRTVTIRIKD